MSPDRGILEAAVEHARMLGADVAGWVPAGRLIGSPSAVATGVSPPIDNGSFLVIGLGHPPEKPELDHWEEGRSTPGDRILQRIAAGIVRWLIDEHGRAARVIPYQIGDGGIFLKDAAILAGLGVMGDNNLVLVPGFGPRIRFRALWADLKAGDTPAPRTSGVCRDCPHPCRSECPMGAFATGRYSRRRCMERMDRDRAEAGPVIDHCRICELVCRAE
ncbi:MAG: hypothetical protein ACXQTN_03815 [Methanoculleaceae archaeon]